jgi:hypothetical protein
MNSMISELAMLLDPLAKPSTVPFVLLPVLRRAFAIACRTSVFRRQPGIARVLDLETDGRQIDQGVLRLQRVDLAARWLGDDRVQFLCLPSPVVHLALLALRFFRIISSSS